MRLAVELDAADALAPGAAVTGRVVVHEGGRARSLAVALAFVERTKDYRRAAVKADRVPLAEGDLPAGASFGFSLALPTDARVGVRTSAGSLGWEVTASVDRLGPDVRARAEVALGAVDGGGPGPIRDR